jgi:hypothetical protein
LSFTLRKIIFHIDLLALTPPPHRQSFTMSGPTNGTPAQAEATTSNETETFVKSYEDRAKAEGMLYTISDVPPLHLSVLFGFQHYFTLVGALVLVPLILTPPMGATPKQTAEGALPLTTP